MRIDGQWLVCDDGVMRPVISGEILAGNGSWEKSEFLVDIGTDRTVFSAVTLANGRAPKKAIGRVAADRPGRGSGSDRSRLV